MSNIKIIDANLVNTEESVTADLLRQAIGNTKTFTSNGLTDDGQLNSNILFYDIVDNPTETKDSEFYSQAQTIRIVGNEAITRDQRSWVRFLNSIIPKTSFLDHTFNFNTPSDEGSFEPLTSNLVTNMTQEASYYRYEDLTKTLNSKVLPNYSALQHYKYNDQSEELKNLLDFGGSISLGTPVGSLWYENYFNSFLQDSMNVIENSAEAAGKNTNIFLMDDFYELTDKDEVPYHLTIESRIIESAKDLNVSKALSDLKKRKNVFSFIKNSQPVVGSFVTSEGDAVSVPVRDMLQWAGTSGQTIFQEGSDELFLLPESERGSESVMDNLLRSSMLYGWLLANTKTKLRNLEDMLDYQPCYRETIGFKIEKYLNSEVTEGLEQTYYYFGKSMRMIDTQIVYDQKYIYKISAITVILGTEYKYRAVKHSSEDGFIDRATGTQAIPTSPDTLNYLFSAEITVVSSPSIKIVEIPLRSSPETFVGNPPNTPDVKFSNDSGMTNELKIYVSNNFLDIEEEYVPLSLADKEVLDKYYLSQNISSGKIKTSYINNSGVFAIYRMDQEPTRIEDFGQNFLVNITTNVDYLSIDDGGKYKNPPYSKSAQYTDFILPNKKYYYLFKALDFHRNGGPSTVIYQVELLESSDGTYIEVREFTFKEQKDYRYQIPMRRFMQLRPNPLQTTINQNMVDEQGMQSAYNYTSPIELGVSDNSLFGRKFKIRVTSKHTGKKVDINVVFRKKLE